jgi:hypothetical protein
MDGHPTFQDAIDQLLDYLGADPSDSAVRDCRRAAIEAYRTLTNAHNWTYLYAHGRVITSPAFEAGTIAYDHEDGTYPRQVTLSGDTWPEWAADGTYLRVGQVAYRVAERKSATVLTLDEAVNPGADLDAGTAYTLYRDTYLLPEDYSAQDQAWFERNFGGMGYTHPREWLYENRYNIVEGDPAFYTITGDTKYPGRLVLRVHPWPREALSIDFLYKRRPRPLVLSSAAAGTVSTTAGSTTVTGVGTAFTPKMVGSVIRVSSNAETPSSIVGLNPPAFESIVAAYISGTQVAVADPAGESLAGKAYIVSDIIDVEPGAMLNAYWRACEMHLGMNRTLKDKPSARAQYNDEVLRAKAADSRSFAGRSAGDPIRHVRRLRDMPWAEDLSSGG